MKNAMALVVFFALLTMFTTSSVAAEAAKSKTITGSISAGELVGGAGVDKIGPITDGTATWEFGGESPLILQCLLDADCEIALSGAAGDSVILGGPETGINTSNAKTHSQTYLFGGIITQSPMTFATLSTFYPTCGGTIGDAGTTVMISDSTTETIGTPIAGMGSYLVQAMCNGTNWVVGAGGVPSTVSGTAILSTATADNFTITGVTPSSVCVFSPTNPLAANQNTTQAYISAVAPNMVTITHAAVVAGGATVNILCTN